MQPAFRLPEEFSDQILAADAGRLQCAAVAVDQYAVQGEQTHEAKQRIDDVAQTLFTRRQPRGGFQTLRHIADSSHQPDGFPAIVAQDAAARYHPAVGSVAMFQPQLVVKAIFRGIAIVFLDRLRHALAVVRMDAPEERFRVAGQFVVAVAENLFVARRQIVLIGHQVPIEDPLMDCFGDQRIARFAFPSPRLRLQPFGDVAAIP
ncbi:MAG TPA: hypothetical protein VFW44_14980 [Bryobacteraceae bacterium]|nr:hypothetical protein [Bryobacteraceae bacterium]